MRVEGRVEGEIGVGLLVLLGIAQGDAEADAARLAGKVARLRVFENDEGRLDRSLLDAGGAALVVSQFTLIADTQKGNRPGFAGAASTQEAELCSNASASRSESSASRSRPAYSAPEWKSSS